MISYPSADLNTANPAEASVHSDPSDPLRDNPDAARHLCTLMLRHHTIIPSNSVLTLTFQHLGQCP
jgi:hypothetical protein